MKKIICSILSLLLIFFIVGCSSSQATQSPQPTPTELPQPEAGKASLIGQVIKNGKPYSNATVRLAEIFRGADNEAAFALNEAASPSTISDEEGYYVFSNTTPGEYVIIVGSLNTNYQIDSDSNSVAVIRKLEPDKILNVEIINVNLP
jgi:uncharacterized GH25 family protein